MSTKKVKEEAKTSRNYFKGVQLGDLVWKCDSHGGAYRELIPFVVRKNVDNCSVNVVGVKGKYRGKELSDSYFFIESGLQIFPRLDHDKFVKDAYFRYGEEIRSVLQNAN